MPVIPKTFKEEGRFESNPNDFFETPYKLARSILDFDVFWSEPDYVLDPGCGTGSFGKAIKDKWPDTHLTGIDISNQDAGFGDDYDYFILGDYLEWKTDRKFDLIIGNPPYSSKTDRRLAEKFILKSFDLLTPDGILCFLLKTEFLASNVRFENLWKKHLLKYVVQSVDRIQWRSGGGNTIEYAYFIWNRNLEWYYPQVRFMKWKGDKVEFA